MPAFFKARRSDFGAFLSEITFCTADVEIINDRLRRPNLLKYLAGPEIGGGNFLSDTAPEEKAAELRAAGDMHYKTCPVKEGNEPPL